MTDPDRIDCDEEGVDDVVLNDVVCLRLERMGRKSFWLACYMRDGSHHVFRLFSGETMLRASYEHEPRP